MGQSASSLEGSSLRIPSLDQEGLFKQICSSVEHLLKKPKDLYSVSSSETIKRFTSLGREVIKLAKTDLIPDLHTKFFALYEEFNHSTNCSALLEKEWCSIEDDEQTQHFLKAMTYLKLSAFCAFDDARYVWARLAEKVKYVRLPYEALENLDLIKLHIAGDDDHITAYHEFVGQGMSLLCEAYYEQSPKYKLYMALKEADVPWGSYCPRGYNESVDTDEMVNFLISQLEGN
jgi:hypothetical protein